MILETAPVQQVGGSFEAASLQVLIFTLAEERYAVPATAVREIVRHRQWTPVPGAPATLPGIISQRGVIVPVVELRTLLGLPEQTLGRSSRLVVLRHDDVDMALLVEAVFDLVEVPVNTAEQPPLTLDPARAGLIAGVVRHEDTPVMLVNLEALITALMGG